MTDEDVLDNAAWWALTGPHEELALGWGGARRYPPDMAPFAAIPDVPPPSAWDDLAAVAAASGAGDVVLFRAPVTCPAGWREIGGGTGVQLVWRGPAPDVAPGGIVDLGPGDADEVTALVGRTRPGPFARRTLELGRYLGVRDPQTGALVAMGGERLRPEGFCEISAVCTDAAWRGRGLATGLVRALVAGVVGRGEVAFLHAAADNTAAIRLYVSVGFAYRRDVTFSSLRPPGLRAGSPSAQ